MLTQEQLANRRRFISALKANAPGYKQITGSLAKKRQWGEVCALGMGLDEFGIDSNVGDAYNKLAALFGLRDSSDPHDREGIRYVYHLNDNEHLSFAQIAARLEKEWRLY
jgi:hypothetical protein